MQLVTLTFPELATYNYMYAGAHAAGVNTYFVVFSRTC